MRLTMFNMLLQHAILYHLPCLVSILQSLHYRSLSRRRVIHGSGGANHGRVGCQWRWGNRFPRIYDHDVSPGDPGGLGRCFASLQEADGLGGACELGSAHMETIGLERQIGSWAGRTLSQLSHRSREGLMENPDFERCTVFNTFEYTTANCSIHGWYSLGSQKNNSDLQ